MNGKTDLYIYLGITLSVFWLEFYFSYRRTSLKDRLVHLAKDLPFALMNILVPPMLIKASIKYFGRGMKFIFPDFEPIFQSAFLEGSINIGLVLIAGLIFSDFVGYTTHRWMFHSKYFWFLHKTHHSSKVVRWHSSFRFNPFELCITTSLIYMVYYILGVPFHIFYSLSIFNYLSNYLAHSELPIGNRYIEMLFVTPNYHRLHHQSSLGRQKSNYSGVFTVWDSLFGSKAAQVPVEELKLGVEK